MFKTTYIILLSHGLPRTSLASSKASEVVGWYMGPKGSEIFCCWFLMKP